MQTVLEPTARTKEGIILLRSLREGFGVEIFAVLALLLVHLSTP